MKLATLRFAFLLPLLLALAPASRGRSADAASESLNDALIAEVSRYAEDPTVAPRPDRVRELLAAGASPSARNRGGSTAVNLAVETYAYVSTAQPQNPGAPPALAAIEAVRLLLEAGGDPSEGDASGLTPLMHLLNYGPADVTRVLDLLLARGPDLERLSLTSLVPVVNFARGRRAVFERLLALNPRLDYVDRYGATLLHATASNSAPEGTPLLLELVAERVPPAFLRRHIGRPDLAGNTPVHFAARAGNARALRLLVSKYGARLSARNSEGFTPLELALERRDAATAAVLRSLGSPPPEPVPQDVRCDAANRGSLTRARFYRIWEKCRPASMEAMLALLPWSYRAGHTLAYSTRAAQQASPDFPQAIVYGREGQVLLAFNGHPSQKGYNDLEILAFDPATARFEARAIDFSSGRGVLTEPNPTRCTSCHGANPRILWDNWTFWPGKFNGEMERVYAYEIPLRKRFARNRGQGRYRHLPEPFTFSGLDTPFGKDLASSPIGLNTRMDTLSFTTMALRNARWTRDQPLLAPFKFALLGALSCGRTPMSEFLTPAWRARLPRSEAALLAEGGRFSRAEFLDRARHLHALQPAAPQGRYVIDEALWPDTAPSSAGGRSFEMKRIARARYLLEGLGLDISDWFTLFDGGERRYVADVWAPQEAALWREWIVGTTEPELEPLRAAFAGAWADLGGAGLFYEFIGGTPREAAACSLLRDLSLRRLAAFPPPIRK